MHVSPTSRTSPEGRFNVAPSPSLARSRAGVPDPDAQRRDDVALFAVLVVEQRQPRRAVGIVLDRGHPRRNPELLAAEVDLPEHLLGPAAPMADGDPPVD